MKVTEEAARRRDTLKAENPEKAYSEIKDLLERRMSFDKVEESKYFHDVETGEIRSEIEALEFFDNKTRIKLEINLSISPETNQVEFMVKSNLVTAYPAKGYKDSLWYYAALAIRDKFIYGGVREGYEEAAEHKIENLMDRVRQTMGADEHV